MVGLLLKVWAPPKPSRRPGEYVPEIRRGPKQPHRLGWKRRPRAVSAVERVDRDQGAAPPRQM